MNGLCLLEPCVCYVELSMNVLHKIKGFRTVLVDGYFIYNVCMFYYFTICLNFYAKDTVIIFELFNDIMIFE